MIELYTAEKQLIHLLETTGFGEIDRSSIRRGFTRCDETTSYEPQFVACQAQQELVFSGTNAAGNNFQACLKLLCIRELTNWNHPRIALKSSYPEMAKDGDWSAIRDSDDAKIDKIFYDEVMPLVENVQALSRRDIIDRAQSLIEQMSDKEMTEFCEKNFGGENHEYMGGEIVWTE